MLIEVGLGPKDFGWLLIMMMGENLKMLISLSQESRASFMLDRYNYEDGGCDVLGDVGGPIGFLGLSFDWAGLGYQGICLHYGAVSRANVCHLPPTDWGVARVNRRLMSLS